MTIECIRGEIHIPCFLEAVNFYMELRQPISCKSYSGSMGLFWGTQIPEERWPFWQLLSFLLVSIRKFTIHLSTHFYCFVLPDIKSNYYWVQYAKRLMPESIIYYLINCKFIEAKKTKLDAPLGNTDIHFNIFTDFLWWKTAKSFTLANWELYKEISEGPGLL